MGKAIGRMRLLPWVLAGTLLLGLLPAKVQAAAEYTAAGATAFTFTDSGITAKEGDYSGYKISGTELTINEAGTYLVSGSCADGSIKIKKGTTGVTLVLKGLDLTSGDTAPIACNKSSEVTIVAAAGTTNTLTDSAENNDDNYADNENAENAVIKCKDGSQVTISGSGTLNVNANGKNGIKSGATTETEGEASLTISGVTLNITAAVNDAINAEELLDIESGTLTILAGDDAIHCDRVMNIGSAGTTGPTITITSCYEGIEAAELNICSGTIDITSTDDCLNAANSDLGNYAFTMTISGGTITAYSSEGDGFDSNGDLTISGGNVTVWTANRADNQPLDADGTLTLSGGTVLAAGGSGGMGVTISASQPYVVYGSTGGMGGGQAPGNGQAPGGMNSSTGSTNSGADSTTSTGSTASGTAPGAPGGAPGMGGQPGGMGPGNGQAPGSGAGFGGGAGTSITKGSTVTIQNASGTAVYTGTAACDASYVLYSSDKLTAGTTYTLTAGSTTVGTAEAQTGTATGGMGGGQTPGNGQAPGNSGSNAGTGSGSDSSGSASGGSNSGSTGSDGAGTPPQAPGGFQDVGQGDWFFPAVDYVTKNGWMTGVGQGTFDPAGTAGRGQIVTILWRLAGSPAAEGTAFSDVAEDAWYAQGVAWASANGIVTGYQDGTFGPEDAVTREQLAAILYRYARYMGWDTTAAGQLDRFSDGNTVAAYAKEAMAWANGAGLVNGTDGGALAPAATATRSQVAAIIMRMQQGVAQ